MEASQHAKPCGSSTGFTSLTAILAVLPLQLGAVGMLGLAVMYVFPSQLQVRAQLLFPVNHFACYSNEVPLHIIVPVQLLLQVRVGTGREGGDIGWKIRRYEK